MGEPTLDPREILKAAGVECPEVDNAAACWDRGGICEDTIGPDKSLRERCIMYDSCQNDINDPDHGLEKSAVLALARLVAQYKWQRDTVISDWMDEEGIELYHYGAQLDCRWSSRAAARVLQSGKHSD